MIHAISSSQFNFIQIHTSILPVHSLCRVSTLHIRHKLLVHYDAFSTVRYRWWFFCSWLLSHLRMHTFDLRYTCVSYDEVRSRTFRSTSMMIQSQPYFENPGRIVFMFLTYFAFASWIFWSIELSHLKPEINHTIKNISVVQNVKHRHTNLARALRKKWKFLAKPFIECDRSHFSAQRNMHLYIQQST